MPLSSIPLVWRPLLLLTTRLLMCLTSVHEMHVVATTLPFHQPCPSPPTPLPAKTISSSVSSEVAESCDGTSPEFPAPPPICCMAEEAAEEGEDIQRRPAGVCTNTHSQRRPEKKHRGGHLLALTHPLSLASCHQTGRT